MDNARPLDAPPPPRRVPLLGWIVVAILLAVGTALAIPGYHRLRMPARLKSAEHALRRIATTETTWRVQDCDRNGVADYWTRDVAGFH